nr:LytTR family DNA-binding domain-containing protein [uncultured Cellulosilyticum sp.]
MKIGICEDENILRQEVRLLVEKYCQQCTIEAEIFEYSSGEELLQSNNEESILLLDISMKEIDGIQTAEKIRALGNNSIIIFLTSHKERVFEAFKVQAFRYLLKSIEEIEFNKTLDDAVNYLKKEEKKFLTISIKKNIIKLNYEDILYVESIGKNINIHTLEQCYTIREKISDLEKKLQSNGFFRVHKSYIVNLEKVTKIDNDRATLQNNEIVYVSRLRYKAFKEAFMNHLIKDKKIWN